MKNILFGPMCPLPDSNASSFENCGLEERFKKRLIFFQKTGVYLSCIYSLYFMDNRSKNSQYDSFHLKILINKKKEVHGVPYIKQSKDYSLKKL